ncbi:unnamed protein product [Brugia timori]|uniref:Uncharacterized protein n=1 Tax=Brugia timori TaxID=42155 RepID=A0A0R3R3D9_9BILA|nr:unnamed protein product [Brugia timori]
MLSSKVIFRKVARAEGHFFIYIDSLWKINEIYISTSGPVWAYYTNHPSTDHSFVKTFSGDIIAIFEKKRGRKRRREGAKGGERKRRKRGEKKDSCACHTYRFLIYPKLFGAEKAGRDEIGGEKWGRYNIFIHCVLNTNHLFNKLQFKSLHTALACVEIPFE